MKSQVQTQIFTYILGIIIIAGVLLVGYMVLGRAHKDIKSVNLNNFRLSMEEIIGQTSEEYGSLRKERISVPSDFNEVCFVNSDVATSAASVPSEYPLIKDSVESGVQKDVFLNGEKVKESLFIDRLVVDGNFLCLENKQGIRIKVEGLGDKARLSEDTS